MNKFKYETSGIMESHFNFNNLSRNINFKGTAELSATFSIPKDPEDNNIIRCLLTFSLGENSDQFHMFVKFESYFSIEGMVETETLQEDAQKECYPKSVDILSKKIAQLTEIHIGKALNVPLPTIF